MDQEVVEQKLESLRRCLQRIEDKCPAEADTLNLKKSVGFRNIAVHNYDAINWQIVYSIVKNHLVDFSTFARIVAMKLDG
jgi:uncharacterized protein YutE (UPF0331/DUF86 family)